MFSLFSRRWSLLTLLGLLVILTVTLFFGAHAFHTYQTQRDYLVHSMHLAADESLERLGQSVTPLLEAYAVQEYEQLIETEIGQKHYLAIVVNNRLLGEVLGRGSYVSGRIHTEAGGYEAFDEHSPAHWRRVTHTDFRDSRPLYGSQGAQIGQLTIYLSDAALQAELNHLLRDHLLRSLGLGGTLMVLLLYLLRRTFLMPLHQLAQTLRQRDEDGIPLHPAPEFPARELNTLSLTLNRMLALVRRSRDELSRERERLQHVIDATHVGTWEWEIRSGTCRFNERWAEMAGYTLAELQPISIDSWVTLVHPDDLRRSHELLEQHFRGELAYYECEARMRHKDGHWVWVLDRGRVMVWSDLGEPLLMMGTHQDISARKQEQAQRELAASVFDHAQEGIFITDCEGVIVDTNAAASRITGYAREELIGNNPRLLKSHRQSSGFYQGLWQRLLQQGYWSGEIWNRRKNGEIYPEWLTISAVGSVEQGNRHYVALFADITALKAHEQQLEQIAYFDALTGLANRLLLGDRLRQALSLAKRHGTSVAVVFLDLDGFKAVNDSHGHARGDQLLIEIAARMRAVLRDGDTLARLGGDEFVAVLPDAGSQQRVIGVLERLLEAVSSAVQLDHLTVRVSASLGVSFYPQAQEVDADQLLRQADMAMYQAKLMGKSCYQFFDTHRDETLRHQHGMHHRIAQGIEAGEFLLHYQPKVNMRTGNLVGVEALLRWQHPDDGLLTPGQFLPVVENSDLMLVLGGWVLEQALGQLAVWNRQGVRLSVSVNIAARQLQQPTFVDALGQLLQRYPTVAPAQLELEILETSAMDNTLHVSSTIRQCQALGVSFALDDFGTGYASLSYLKRLPIEVVKIDQSFVRDMLEDPEDLSILEGIIGLAGAFQCQVVAEGVENAEQGEVLLWLGCEVAQGYFISRPLAPEALLAWREHWQPDVCWLNREPVDRDYYPLIHAMVEHRAWVRLLTDFLLGRTPQWRPEAEHADGFDRWLDSEAPYLDRQGHQLLVQGHDALHQQAEQLLQLKTEGQTEAVLKGLPELQRLSQALIEQVCRQVSAMDRHPPTWLANLTTPTD